MMTPEEELELPPWTKFAIYGVFPWKLLLHVLLLVLVTFQAVSVNALFAPYSRAMWSSVTNIFFPRNFQSLQSSLTSPYQYYIFTQNQTVEDGNRLFRQFFNLPSISLNQVEIYNSSAPSSTLQPPSVTLKKADGSSQIYNVPSLSTLGSSWPLGYGSQITSSPSELRSFFLTLHSMEFYFPIISYGNNDNLNTQSEVCYRWTISFLYDLSSTGQILVTCTSDMVGRCQPLKTLSSIYICSFLAAVLATLYQILIFRASARRILILHSIRATVAQAQKLANSGLLPEDNNAAGSVGDHDEKGRPGKAESGSDDFLTQSPLHVSTNSSIDTTLEFTDVNERLENIHAVKTTDIQRDTLTSTTSRAPSVDSSVGGRQSRSDSVLENVESLKKALDSLSASEILGILNVWFFILTGGNIATLLYSSQVVFFRYVLFFSFLFFFTPILRS